MGRELYQDLRRWLAAEAAGAGDDGAAADRALTRALAGLPRPSPAAGFALRVLERAGVLAAPPQSASGHRARLAGYAQRLAASVALLVAASAAVVVPALLLALVSRLTVGELLSAVAGGARGVAAWLATGVELWSWAAEHGARLMETPLAALAALTMLALASLALRYASLSGASLSGTSLSGTGLGGLDLGRSGGGSGGYA